MATMRSRDTCRALKTAAMAPAPRYFASEVAARYLNLRFNHPSGSDQLEMFPTDPNPLGLPSLENLDSTPHAIRLSVGGAPLFIGGEQIVRNGKRVRMLYEQGLSQTVGGQPLSDPVKAHIRCYLVAGGSLVEP